MRAPKLVVFDVDGTLQDTLAWWPALCNEVRADFAEHHGTSCTPLPREECNALVGRGDIWDALLPIQAEGPERARALRAFADLAIEREVQLLTSGADTMFDGTRALLRDLHEAGVSVALASNCEGRYLQAFVDGQGLAPWIDSARCLDGVRPRGGDFEQELVSDKVAMLQRVLEDFEEIATPREAVMVGDRASDAEAARGNGVRFVLRTGWHEPGTMGEVAAGADSAALRAILEELA